MTELRESGEAVIAIVGGGAAGVLVALQLLRQARTPVRIELIEPHAVLGEGVAYSTARPEHLLNVPAARMSALVDAPQDFVAYLREQACYPELDDAQLALQFVGRRHYAPYLRQRLQAAVAASPASLRVRSARAQRLQPTAQGAQLQLDDGHTLHADAVVLAVGNALRPLPVRGATGLSATQRVEAWETETVAALPPEAVVCIVGSGLSMADTVVTLAAQAHRGAVHVVSRHGLLPLPHVHGGSADFDPQPLLGMPLRARLRCLRQQARDALAQGRPWQGVMERVRPLSQALWQTLSLDDQRRFLRHVVRYWDVHRHRIAAPVHAQLQAMQARGQLQLHRARLDVAFQVGACVRVSAGAARAGHALQLDVQTLVNATGVEMRVQAMRNPLLQQLLGQGIAVAGPHGIGVDTAADGSLIDADGQANPRLRVIGSLRIGSLWESLAVPELREQAAVIAREVCCSLLPPGEGAP
ncbi:MULTISPECIES: FAD/NAD(P)-binding protein [Xanthomonas]|uniref:FAD/NAD(P)-binding protein n=1 Tax=Xanthomonas cucurbitae TaxID=56453 RepID=A0A2S7DRF0_9XANT|nr:FAD/NAD(P)-binding protein [Xanthomonas cucurbitae]PPU76384.1 pyridine nucleotide-disulfide oxidoreductase [Xanthomonas cucurbitae]QHG85736.1 pyridine nucleotide-disulfide oxidoreductase [Xanthomonas cucurbitae]WDM67526.1 FAD/NAD(P)-binding protein [Xanthomonas cucurbitae]WDM71402.1 FAD/NAD(P)-binding protein [Xanthomonas cucurbitae]WDM75621.1 FAD/NAD(P)-binding protein [Xanthomonas cucurbitae]